MAKPKFILVDHSLRRVGGHHYEYALHVLRVIERAGYEIVLATNESFCDHGSLPSHWQVRPLFRYDTYTEFALQANMGLRPLNSRRDERHLPQGREPLRRFVREPFSVVPGWSHAKQIRRKWKRSRHFVRACQTLFSEVKLRPGDQVFVPTLSEFDVSNLVRFLKRAPQTRAADWHLQFHFSIFEGREPDFAEQYGRVWAIQRLLHKALHQIRHHRTFYYSTTEELAAQHNRLGVANFEYLPYPINEALEPLQQERTEGAPLRVTVAGHMRQGKGLGTLSEVVCDLWDDYFCTGKIQLFLQAEKSLLNLPDNVETSLPTTTKPIHYVTFPLNDEDYADLIRRADIGLLLYDSDRYYARCSGVLLELLCSGVPVIVAAGCWMGEQIAEEIFRHLDRLGRELPVVQSHRGDAVAWRAPHAPISLATEGEGSLTFSGAGAGATGELPIPEAATELLVSFRWAQPLESGTYICLKVEQMDAQDTRVGRFKTIVGHRSSGEPVSALIHCKSDARRLRLSWQNAYHDFPIGVSDIQLSFLSAAEMPGGKCPLGRVGLIAADQHQVRELLQDIINNYQHYRASAEEYSAVQRQQHHPRRTVARILSNSYRGGALPGFCDAA